MRTSPMRSGIAFAGVLAIVLAGCTSSPDDTKSSDEGTATSTTREVNDGTTTFTVVENPEWRDQALLRLKERASNCSKDGDHLRLQGYEW